MPTPPKTLEEVYQYALTFYGKPYLWGGDFDERSFGGGDCSSLCQKILAFAGLDPKGDQTADMLYRHFLKEGLQGPPHLGGLAFFGSKDRITHVGWCLNKDLMISAAGGGSHINSIQAARRANAKVRIDPLWWWKVPPLVGILHPRYDLRSV